MTVTFHEHLLKLAAIVYRPHDDVDSLLAGLAGDLLREGHKIGGIVRCNDKGKCGPQNLMQTIDLMTGNMIQICQNLGPGSMSCKLDSAGLADAAIAISRAVAKDVELVIVNKLSKWEVAGQGFRAEIADAIVAGLPVLTAVPERFLDAWHEFTGGFGTTLLCDRWVIDDWWRETSRRDGRLRVVANLEKALG